MLMTREASCQAGYFCAHDNNESTVCCAEGTSLEECASLNDADDLESDSAHPSGSSTDGSAGASSAASEGEDEAEDETGEEPDSGAAGLVPGLALLAGALALLL